MLIMIRATRRHAAELALHGRQKTGIFQRLGNEKLYINTNCIESSTWNKGIKNSRNVKSSFGFSEGKNSVVK